MKKYMLRRRILALILVSIILLFAISVPIGAVVNGSEVPEGSTALYGVSTFPYTVGFVCNDINLNKGMIFATQIGGYGLNDNQVFEGDEVFEWYYPNSSDSEVSAIRYYDYRQEYAWSHWFMFNPDVDDTYDDYTGGYGSLRLEYGTVSSDFNSYVDSIIFRANDVFYNPLWLLQSVPGAPDYYQRRSDPEGIAFMIPQITLPALPDSTNYKFVGRYSVIVSIIDAEGEKHEFDYSVPIDTGLSKTIPFISYDLLLNNFLEIPLGQMDLNQIKGSPTIMIDEYYGYLDVDFMQLTQGVWTKVEDPDYKNTINVTFPTYNTSGAPSPTADGDKWLSWPDADKMMSSVLSNKVPDGSGTGLGEIDEDMYVDFSGWLANAVGGFMEMEIFPGIALGGIVAVLVMFSVVMALLKIFAGG